MRNEQEVKDRIVMLKGFIERDYRLADQYGNLIESLEWVLTGNE